MKRYDHIIFDLDGTISDPGLGITNAIIYTLKKFGIESKREDLYKFIGPPLRETFRNYFGFNEPDTELAVEYYREYFSKNGMYENVLYPNMRPLLQKLCSAGKRLYIATSKPQEYTLIILEYFEIISNFTFISGSNMDGSMSKKSELIGRIVPIIGDEYLANTIMVGDRVYDIDGAKHHKIDSAAVLYGYGDLSELEAAEPTYLIESIEELESLLLGG
ncbi:MAG: HAD hydrolase-like protein [Leptospirales bacterium]|nr:HAD hydrolase-like protein [Leptospirales bacterium]